MATVEERLTALERENAALRKADELQTIALRALATKDEITKLRDTNNSIFDALIHHDQLTNERLGDLQTQMIELDGKTVGMQTEMRHGFKDAQNHIVELDGKTVGVQTEMRQRFDRLETGLSEHTTVLSEHTTVLSEHTTVLSEHTVLLTQILARLPEKP